jgi:threonine dehydratase
MIPPAWLEQAQVRLRAHILETPLSYDREAGLYLKWENRQTTGSFKLRGALNKVLALEEWERGRGLAAASAGNHGQGVALAGSKVGARVLIFASEHAVPAKLEAMRRLGAEVRLIPGGYGEAEAAGLVYAAEHETTWVSPYNDGLVISGQATLALEALAQLERLGAGEAPKAWIVPVGGGGLCAGIASALQSSPARPGLRLVGVQSDASPFFHALFHQGSQSLAVELPSLADGLAGPVEANSVTIPILKHSLDDLVLVSEAEIEAAIRLAWERYGEVIEGSAAAALAAAWFGQVAERPALVVLSGGNIQPELHDRLCAGLARGSLAT